jgi:hypothetical protein
MGFLLFAFPGPRLNISIEHGSMPGRDLDNWSEAERELRGKYERDRRQKRSEVKSRRA